MSVLFVVCVVTVEGQTANGQQTQEASDSLMQQMDSIEISLLTCTPGQQIWSLYGHTAIRYQDLAHNVDLAINYGVFDFNQSNFIIKFVFGRTDYEMGIETFPMFMLEYAREGRGIIEQKLNLSRYEKMAITQALAVNNLPQNRVYRYNYFYDNCTTRARDMIVDHLNGKVEYRINPYVDDSYRQMIHQWNANYPWFRFGKDLLLGVGADSKTDFAQQQFLPDSLRKYFEYANVVEPDGRKHALVDTTFYVLRINQANQKVNRGIGESVRPRTAFLLLFVLTIIVSLIELRRKKTFWLYDVVLLTLDGLAGLCLLAMVFSYHPTVRVNFQILLLNPFSIIFVYSVGNSIIRRKYNKYWTFLFVCVVLSLIGGFFQSYAEGIYLLACTLMVRCVINKYLYSINRNLFTGKKK